MYEVSCCSTLQQSPGTLLPVACKVGHCTATGLGLFVTQSPQQQHSPQSPNPTHISCTTCVAAILQVLEGPATGHGAGQRAAAARHACQVLAFAGRSTQSFESYGFRVSGLGFPLSTGSLQLLGGNGGWLFRPTSFLQLHSALARRSGSSSGSLQSAFCRCRALPLVAGSASRRATKSGTWWTCATTMRLCSSAARHGRRRSRRIPTAAQRRLASCPAPSSSSSSSGAPTTRRMCRGSWRSGKTRTATRCGRRQCDLQLAAVRGCLLLGLPRSGGMLCWKSWGVSARSWR